MSGENLPCRDEGLEPSGSGKRKRTKDLYDNPLGLNKETGGILKDTLEITERRQETDRAIGEAAKQADRPIPVDSNPDVPVPKPRSVPSIQTESGQSMPSGNLFQYRTKTRDTGQSEKEKRAKDYEDSLLMTGANEGYTVPPVGTSKEKSESYPDEKQKLRETAANEGFTIREDLRWLPDESKRRIEKTVAFLDKFLGGNEQQKRFVNGIPAKGEGYQSVMGTYLESKNQSDNATQEDWKNSVHNLNKSSIGQGTMDIYHSGAAGGFDFGNGVLRGIQMIEPVVKKHYEMPWNPFCYTDPTTGIEYQFDPAGYRLYQYRQYFREQAKQHEKARSEDFKKTGISNPGYLGVKEAGTVAQNLATLLVTGWVLEQLGVVGDLGTLALGALNGKGQSYDDHMDRYMKKSEEGMSENEVYRAMRKDGLSDRQARFAIGDRHARMNSDAAAVAGVVKAYVASRIAKATRDGSEGGITKGLQDMTLNHGLDLLMDKTR